MSEIDKMKPKFELLPNIVSSSDSLAPAVISKIAKYITLDAETGGIGHDKSLLTIYFGVFDNDFNLLTELDLAIKPDNDVYNVTAEALNINKINLIEHNKIAITEKDAGQKLYKFLDLVNNQGKTKLIPIGHRVMFDVEFLCNKIISKNTWERFVGYRPLDTATIGQFLIERGELPPMKASLGELAKHYGIEFDAHNAREDAIATALVVKKMLGK